MDDKPLCVYTWADALVELYVVDGHIAVYASAPHGFKAELKMEHFTCIHTKELSSARAFHQAV